MNMTYKITQKVLDLVDALFNEGYEGECTITNGYCTGTADVLGDTRSCMLTGFCKETLHLVEDTDTGEIVFVGRYGTEKCYENPTVEYVVAIARDMSEIYGTRGYGMPSEFETLFLKYGYIKEEIVTKKVYKKIK